MPVAPATATPTSNWQPPQRIRPLAIGIIRDGARVLLMAVHDRHGLKGWRPLGGGIEFGERADAALIRELREETGEEIAPPTLLRVIENHYEMNGVAGHEIVFVFEARFARPQAYQRLDYSFADGDASNLATWVDIADIAAGAQTVFPPDIAGLITGPSA